MEQCLLGLPRQLRKRNPPNDARWCKEECADEPD